MPTTAPIATSRKPPATIDPVSLPSGAPSEMRIPISFVRSVTKYRQQSIQAERGEQQSTDRKRRGDERVQSLARDAFAHRCFHRHHRRDREVGIDLVKHLHGAARERRCLRRANQQRHACLRHLLLAVENCRPDFAANRAFWHVSDHSDDLPVWILGLHPDGD